MRIKDTTRRCASCGDDFHPQRERQRFCRRRCADDARRVPFADANAMALADAGFTLAEIGDRLDASVSAIHERLMRAGYERKGPDYAPDPPLSEPERAYLAGIIDGEGTIFFGFQKPHRPSGQLTGHWCVRVSVVNTDARLIEWLVTRFPHSHVGFLKKQSDRHRDVYRWTTSNLKAVPVIDAAFPYLVLKQAQATLARRMMETHVGGGRGRQITAEVFAERSALATEMKALNKRGRWHPHDASNPN